MISINESETTVVELPWSDGTLSARLWSVGDKKVVGVPELGLHCYGSSQTEAVFRLFTSLLKYYRQLKNNKADLPEKAIKHLELLSIWVGAIENKMKVKDEPVGTAKNSSGRVISMRSFQKTI